MDARMRRAARSSSSCARRWPNGEFELYYQPVVEPRRPRTVSGCEALLRWNHPERGMISPAEFIPIAEEIGLIVPIGEWVLRRACEDASAWPDDIARRRQPVADPVQATACCCRPWSTRSRAARLPAHGSSSRSPKPC